MEWSEIGKKKDTFFSNSDLAHFSFKKQLDMIMETIQEFGEISIFGMLTRWKVSDSARRQAIDDVRLLYSEYKKHRFDMQSEYRELISSMLTKASILDEDMSQENEDEIYRLTIGRFLQMCLCHEGYMMTSMVDEDITQIGLKELSQEEANRIVYGFCRIHESGGATYMSIYADRETHPDGLELTIMTEQDAIDRFTNCNIVMTNSVHDHKTLYYLDPQYRIPDDLPKKFTVLHR